MRFKMLYGKKETYSFWYKLYCMSLKGMNMDLHGDIYSSGESKVCEFLKSLGGQNKVLFDVGTNKGNYTKMLKEYFPDARIHCFEPAQETFRILKESVGADKNIRLNNVALSDKSETATLYYDKDASGLASLYNRQLDYFNIEFSKSETVKTETLDEYCEREHIEAIDFLKMDIEGNELKALQGAEKLLKEGRIRAIQIEFGGCNIDSRTYFRDFWNLLHENFEVYRILKNGLWKIEQYAEKMECFCNMNYLFVKK